MNEKAWLYLFLLIICTVAAIFSIWNIIHTGYSEEKYTDINNKIDLNHHTNSITNDINTQIDNDINQLMKIKEEDQ